MADVDSVDIKEPEGSNVPGWFDLSTPDSDRARAFYAELLGWKVQTLDDSYSLIVDKHGEATGGIGSAGPDAPYTGLVVYFPVDNVDAAIEKAEKLGATRVFDPVEVPGRNKICVFKDLDGNAVGLMGP
ncbi:VOC family protein [Asanoa siamensis]|uniref:VOC domain-containing protein n=1 Tax=Asanoa siamensis TaxID=926357 RepID=A0ABQ4CLG3_9ACTN|nr:VOC family protein [Asanoa siamensis]GIF72105.1 hypothetical protein Asi02nite_16230 [Asanoa siamensis]